MVKTENNNFILTLLLAALFFTLSAIPGIHSEAEVGTVSMPSTKAEIEASAALNDIHGKLKDDLQEGQEAGEPVSENVTIKQSGTTFTATVSARLVKLPASQRLGDLQPTPERKVVQYSIDSMAITTGCDICPNGTLEVQSEQSIQGQIEEPFKEINLKIFQKVKSAQAEMVKKAQEEVALQQKKHTCEISSTGGRLSGAAQLTCRVQRFNQLAEGERENYYDLYIREDLHKNLKDGSGAMRDHAMAQVSALQQGAGNSTYLTASLKDMQMFGEAHKAAEKIIANGRTSPSYRQDLATFQRANNYLRSRGMTLNENVASALGLTTDQHSNELANLTDYEQKLNQLAQQHRSLLNGQQPLANGVRPLGQPGRQQYGAPVTSYPGLLPPNSAAPGVGRPGVQQPGRPGVGAPVGRGGPQIGAPVGSVR